MRGGGERLAPEPFLMSGPPCPRGAGLLAPLESTRSWHCCAACCQVAAPRRWFTAVRSNASQGSSPTARGWLISEQRPPCPPARRAGSFMPGHTQPWETSSPPSSHGEPAFQLVVQFSPSSSGPTYKASRLSQLRRHPGALGTLLSSSVQMSISSKTTVFLPSSCDPASIRSLCEKGNWMLARQNCLPGVPPFSR